MRIYSTITYKSSTPSVVALGCFDGVHIGHSTVIGTAKKKANELNCKCIVWTFEEPPKNYFLPKAVPLITVKAEKEKLIEDLGTDILVSVPFTKETAKITAEDFFENIIKDKLKARHIVCGFNYTFGAMGKGNVALLRTLCDKNDIGLTVLPPVSKNGITVSSSAIREALLEGNPSIASELLGRHYSLKTTVINGQHLATKLGFPTLNQEFLSGVVVPKHGVYATRITVKGSKKAYYGISNIGLRPTVGGTSLFAETHIFDFSQNLYGKTVKVEFLKFIRPEQKFQNLEQLTAQVNKDIEIAKAFIKESII